MTQKRSVITTTEAPGAVGPYSQAVATDSFIFTAGQIPINPASGSIEAEAIEEQTRQVLSNIDAVLRAAGSGLHRVVKMTVFMTDLGDFQAMNGVYAEFFPSDPPARSAVQVAALPLGVQIEMEAIALRG
jgi:2-iminobutanoate/2-iminopropanoate deaminase